MKVSRDNLLNAAMIAHQKGLFEEAEDGYRKLLEAYQEDAQVLFQLGTLKYQTGAYEEAVKYLQYSLKIEPENIRALNSLGVSYFSLNDVPRAINTLEHAIRRKPNDIDLHVNKGNILKTIGRYEQALECFQSVLELDENNLSGNYGMADVLDAMGRHEECLKIYEIIRKIEKNGSFCNFKIATQYQKLKKITHAISYYKEAIRLDPRYAEAHNNLAAVCFSVGMFKEAVDSFTKAIEIDISLAEAYDGRGTVFQAQGDLEAAVRDHSKAIEISPKLARAYNNRGTAYRVLGKIDDAERDFDAALKFIPEFAEAHSNRALLYLLKGDYDLGWKMYEWRLQTEKFLSSTRQQFQNFPTWTGTEDIAGKKILLYSEQGLGDTIFFCRYAVFLKGRGAIVTLAVQDVLVDLIKSLSSSIVVVKDSRIKLQYDYYLSLLSLPAIFTNNLKDIPLSSQYLKVATRFKERWRGGVRKSKRLQVGLVCSGNPMHPDDFNRSIEASKFSLIVALSADFHLLQTQIRKSDNDFLNGRLNIRRYDGEIQSFSDTAAIIDQLDLIISVDTSVAHLAAALGKPVWILLPLIPDYRWMLDRDDSPWYSSASLYRQSSYKDWTDVINRVVADLNAFIQKFHQNE